MVCAEILKELRSTVVTTYRDDLTPCNYKSALGHINPYYMDIHIDRAEKAGDFATANIMREYAVIGKVAEKLRVENYIHDLAEKKEAAQEIINELKTSHYKIKSNKYNWTLKIWHGTSKKNAKKILKEGKFNKWSFFNKI